MRFRVSAWFFVVKAMSFKNRRFCFSFDLHAIKNVTLIKTRYFYEDDVVGLLTKNPTLSENSFVERFTDEMWKDI